MKKLIIIFYLLSVAIANAQSGKAVISGRLSFLNNNDSVSATVLKYGDFEGYELFQTQKFDRVNGKSFRLELPVTDRPLFFNIDLSPKKLEKDIFGLVVEAGDSVVISEVNNTYSFSGKGSQKYNLVMRLKTIENKWQDKSDLRTADSAKHYLQNMDSSVLERQRLLEVYKSSISSQAYHLLHNFIFTSRLYTGFIWPFTDVNFLNSYRKSTEGYFSNSEIEKNILEMKRDSAIAYYSSGFFEAVKYNYKKDSCYLIGKPYSDSNYYKYVKRNYSGSTRDGLVTWFIYNSRHRNDSLSVYINDAISYIQVKDFRDLLLSLQSTGLKGSPAFNFSLTDAKGKKREFSEFKGKVVLLDFWYTGCPACKEMAPYLRRIEENFKGRNVVFITVSIDKNKVMWKTSVKANSYSSNYSLNLFTDGLGMKNPVIEYYKLSSFPTLILIDKDGFIGETVKDPRADNGKLLTESLNKDL